MQWHFSRKTHNNNSFFSIPFLLLLLLVFLAGTRAQQDDFNTTDTQQGEDICTMTEVLKAMKELLVMLSGEIKDLRKQVGLNCMSVNATMGTLEGGGDFSLATPSCDDSMKTNEDGGAAKGGEADGDADDEMGDNKKDMTTEATPSDEPDEFELELDDAFDSFDDHFDEDLGEDEDYGNVTNPFDDVADGLADWWGTFSLFKPQPTDTPEGETEPEDGREEGIDEYDEYDEQLYTEAPGTTDTEGGAVRLPRPPPRTTTTTTTTTTPPPPPYELPPVPTSCPDPFRLLADSCYLIWNNRRDWRTWGEAEGVCQGYGGRLAAPWRLRPLQEFLARFYSDAFWIGAQFDTHSRSWKWLSGRPVDEHEWKAGQPSRHPGKRCMLLNKSFGYQGLNFFCGEKYPFLCEYQPSFNREGSHNYYKK